MKKSSRPPSTLKKPTRPLIVILFSPPFSHPPSLPPPTPLLSHIGDSRGAEAAVEVSDEPMTATVTKWASLADPPLVSLKRGGSDDSGAREGGYDGGGQEALWRRWGGAAAVMRRRDSGGSDIGEAQRRWIRCWGGAGGNGFGGEEAWQGR